MSRYRRAAKIDDSQRAIVAGLRDIPGVTVALGHDDILVGHRGRTYWFELKRPDIAHRPSALTESQKNILEHWRGHYRVVSTLDEIIFEINGGLR